MSTVNRSFSINEDTSKRLEKLAELTGHSKSYLAENALSNFLEEFEDMLIATSRIMKRDKQVPLAKVKKDLGID